ncbi:hypothetical protein [Chryseolinea soli]|uniref:Uncharacterized protein n=1 Tax=Chryseolinea soli TaxID=2321403 RepID=A0A385SNJ8_9BACT|nr:hypothetical protein [Chryseolinea soli]AYB31931.1 hypothetical protein D4L85_15765 [Chryseolinea soli]
MGREFMTAAEWLALKIICGQIYQHLLADEPIPDDLYFAVLKYMDLPADTLCDYFLFGSCQYRMVTKDITLLYNHHYRGMEKRQIYLYATPARCKPYHPK